MGFFSHFMAAVSDQKTGTELPADARLIDVRTHSEFISGHIEGAINLPLNRFNHDIHQVIPDKSTPVVLYCRSGARSGHALSVMHQLGYTQVFNGGSVGSLALRVKKEIKRGV
ncbi:rhodanese-like domain-containing protein [Ferrovum sp.]|uniref:rhodanese-like domain-containing protein n=1 Tax=Ferrovum sp. TaxID=2609467 RepID=UPI00260C41FB|nr:rhodanese-like domain-containing protein [Ferrovum sp.]